MFKFVKNGDKLNIVGANTTFSGVSAYVLLQNDFKVPLAVTTVSEDKVVFSDDKAVAEVTVIEKDGIVTFFAKGNLVRDRSKNQFFDNAQTNLNSHGSFHLNFEGIDGLESYTVSNLKTFWTDSAVIGGDDLKNIPNETQAMLYKVQDKYGYMICPCDKKYKAVLVGSENGFSARLQSYKRGMMEFEGVLFFFAIGDEPYSLPEKATEFGLKYLGKKAKIANKRRYPETFEYLGWCSWDAFHMDVTHDDLLKKADEFKQKEIPVRWMIIDDMWAECHNNNRKTMHSREMYNFEADPQRFPNGLSAAVKDLKNDYGMKVGIWYPTTGYWNGIDPEGPIAKEHSDLLTVGLNGRLLPSPDQNKLFQYFYMYNSFFRYCGADFVKVDYQSCILENYNRLVPVGLMASNLQTAIEATVGVCFDGNLINCMGMANENFWNRPNSIVNRISGDFMPEDRKWFVQHLIQCSFNAFAQGSIYTGDWDMWWSDDAQGTKNAVLRAMSGGPVYVSDELGRSIKEKIMPIVYSDGKIIRLKESARPVPECLITDCEHNGKIFKVFNKTENGGILAAFNIDEEEKSVSGNISVKDVYGMSDCRCAVIDYFAKTVTVLEKGETLDLALKNYDDFRLYYVIELNSDITPIGIMDKYMAPATFEMIASNKCIVAEGGQFFFTASNVPEYVLANGIKMDVTPVGKNLCAVELPKDEINILLEWK